MDPLAGFAVRFHFDGKFVCAGRSKMYIGGEEIVALLEDKTMAGVIELLKPLCEVEEGTQLHWLFPGCSLAEGIRLLWDDQSCGEMSACVKEGVPMDIFVEKLPSCGGSEVVFQPGNVEDIEVEVIGNTYVTPIYDSDDDLQFLSNSKSKAGSEIQQVGSSSSDSDFSGGDCSSEDDEVAQIESNYKEFKKKYKAGELDRLDQLILTCPPVDEGNETVSSNDDEASYDEDSDGQIVVRESSHPRFVSKSAVPVFTLGMKFSGKEDFKKAIIKYGLAMKREIKFIKDEGDRCRAKCSWVSCPWFCHLRDTTKFDSWQITSFNDEHTCPLRRDNSLVTSRRIAEKYENLIIANPTWSMQHLKATVQEEMFANVSLSKCKRAKAIVMRRLVDKRRGEYSKVFDYQLELLRSNPGSTVVIKLDHESTEPVFDRFYVCFDAMKKGFEAGCRKVLGLDGCFFKGRPGELLCVVARDANNQLYPVAWAAVDKETNETWDWFLALLCNDLKAAGGEGWVVISDQQKGLLNGVANWLPFAEHRNCARHIYANWRKKYKKKDWQKLFWACAKAPCELLWNKARENLAKVTPDGAQAITRTKPSHWSRAWFRLGNRCDSVDNNMCESFNKWIVEARYCPIISMLETIRRKVMVRIQENKTKSERWTDHICPNIMRKLRKSIVDSAHAHVISNGDGGYEVQYWHNTFTVRPDDRACSCRYWQLSGLPCVHAISVIYTRTNNLDDFIDACYSLDAFRATYAHCLQPLEGMDAWPVSPRPRPMAPAYEKMPGRPKKARTREPQEKPKSKRVSKMGTKIRCGKCKSWGHNRATCDQRNPAPSASAPRHASSASAPRPAPSASAPRPTPSEYYVSPPSGPSARKPFVPVRASSKPSTPSPSIGQNSQKSSVCGKKRKATSYAEVSGPKSGVNSSSTSVHGNRTESAARVATIPGGSASINLNVTSSQSSSSVQVNVQSETASAHARANSSGYGAQASKGPEYVGGIKWLLGFPPKK